MLILFFQQLVDPPGIWRILKMGGSITSFCSEIKEVPIYYQIIMFHMFLYDLTHSFVNISSAITFGQSQASCFPLFPVFILSQANSLIAVASSETPYQTE